MYSINIFIFISFLINTILSEYAINDPVAGTIWIAGKPTKVGWYTSGTIKDTDTITISLVKGDPNDLQLVKTIGQYPITALGTTFQVPADVTSASDYAIKVVGSDGNINFSHFFEIQGGRNPEPTPVPIKDKSDSNNSDSITNPNSKTKDQTSLNKETSSKDDKSDDQIEPTKSQDSKKSNKAQDKATSSTTEKPTETTSMDESNKSTKSKNSSTESTQSSSKTNTFNLSIIFSVLYFSIINN